MIVIKPLTILYVENVKDYTRMVDLSKIDCIMPIPRLNKDGKDDARHILDTIERYDSALIEYPEYLKTPLEQFELVKAIAEKIPDKTVILITQSEFIGMTILKLIDVKKLKPDDVAMYYYDGNDIHEYKIYSNGVTDEPLPWVLEFTQLVW